MGSHHHHQPIRVLNVAEKPSVAKAISTILSENQFTSRNSHSQYNRIFEFQFTLRNQPVQMVVTSVTGHLMELDFHDTYKKWHSCDPLQLYDLPVLKSVPNDKFNIKLTLEDLSRNSHWLVLWLDNDREGENIAFEVLDVCKRVNSRLIVWRALFSAITPRDIHEAVQRLVQPDERKADAVDFRQEIDLRIGASFTRFQTMLLKDKFVFEDEVRVLSYGPCQFPTLGFIVERYWEIQAHEPEEFWVINCSHTSEEGTSTFNWTRGRLFDYTSAVMIYEMCVQEPTATVTNVKNQQKLKYPPYPLSTIELEKRASWYFRMSSEVTMKVAEELYQTGFISYPRTETDSFSERTDLHAIVQEQQGHPVWGSYAQRLLDPGAGLWRNPGNGGHDDKAHPPIHPTKFPTDENRWNENLKRVYELVVRHFLACVSQPAVGAETTVEIDIAGEHFSASGRVIIAKNYLDVYQYESWGNSLIPKYLFGQQFVPTILTLDPGVTRPPPLLSEADLLMRMDKEGIGTDATMHDHIKKLLDRSYATKDVNTRFSPKNLGEALVMAYDDMGHEGLWKPELRSLMERDIKEVSEGRKLKSVALETNLQLMKARFSDARLKKAKLEEIMEFFFDRSNRTGGDRTVGDIVCRCGVCANFDMVLKKKPDGNFMVGCLGYPQCRNVVWLPGSISEATVTTQACNSCTPRSPGPIFTIQFKFRQLEIPPGYNVNHLGCIGGCDETLKELIDICGTRSRNPSVPVSSDRGRGPRASASNGQQTNTRQAACIHCRQTGHSSDGCPSRVVHSQSAPPRRRNSRSGEDSLPCNTCGAPCPLRTANTANNRGRRFYTCQSQDCNFFVWEDSINNTGETTSRSSRGRPESNPARRGGRGRGRGSRGGRQGTNTTDTMFVSVTGDPISGRCRVCGDPSHFENVCPRRAR
ncbi:hypothetical protein IFM89_001729 [Coptis chinensis]|uniref:DNA topoisomerase n=1 Tax=Coptis chinensis TaxID=261450 RepID=A0A835LLA1_9MAGN|nr:hypothetical protein IFM89_001729 [Coptis chinensis]